MPRHLNAQGIHPLAITHAHALAVHELPLIHRDPFDRLIVAQAMLEDMTLLTADRIFRHYAVQIMWCGG